MGKSARAVKRVVCASPQATPANSSYNELVIEAARMSITAGGREVEIVYGDTPHVRFKSYD